MADGPVIVPIDLVVEQIQTGEVKSSDLEKSINDKMKDIAKSAGEALGNLDVSKLNKTLTSAMTGVIKAYDQLASAQSGYNKAINDAGTSTEGFKAAQAEVAELTRQLELATQMFEDYKNSEYGDLYRSASDKLDAGADYSQLGYNERVAFEQYLDYEMQMEDAMARLEAAQAKAKPADFIGEASTEKLDKVIETYGKLDTAIDNTTRATQTWNNAQKEAPYTTEYQRLVDQYDKLMQKIEGLRAAAEKFQETDASTAQWQKLGQDVANARAEMDALVNSMSEMAMSDNAFAVGDSFAEFSNIQDRALAAADAFSEIPLEIGNTTEAMSALNGVTSKFKSAILNACKTAIGWIKRVGSAIASIGSNSKKSEFSLKKLWRQFMMFGLGFRSMYFFVKKIRTAAIGALGDMAKQIPAVNAQMSSIKTSLNTLKGAFATAFQPILPYIAAMFERVAAAALAAANAVAKFFATLTGQGVFYKFTAAAQDYAGAMNSAGGAAKKLKKDLMGFDELNRLSDNDDSGGGGGVGDAGIGSWTEEPLDAKNKLAEMLKDAWSKGDFTEVGTYIAEWLAGALNYAADKIDTKISPWLSKVTKSIATFINGFTAEGTGLPEAVGNFAGSVWDMLVNALNSFTDNAKFDQWGKFLADCIMNIVRNVDLSAGAKALAKLLRGMITMAWTFVKNIDFVEIGTKVGEAIKTFFDTMKVPDETGKTAWTKLGETLSNTINGLGDFIIAVLRQVPWEDVGRAIGEFIAGIDWEKALSNMATIAWEIIKGIGEALKGLSDTSPMTAGLLAVIGSALLGADIIGIVTKVLMLKNVFKKLGAVLAPIKAIIQPIAGGFMVLIGVITSVTSFVDMLRNGFSWLKEAIMLVGIAIAVVGAILLGAAAWPAVIVGAIVAAVATVAVLVKEHWNEIVAWCKEAGAKIAEAVKSALEWCKNILQTALNWIVNLWNTVWTAISTFFTNLWNSIITFLNNAVTAVKNAISNALNWIKTTWNSIWTAISSFFTNIWNGIKSFVTNAISSIKQGIQNGLNSIKQAWSNAWDAVATKVSEVWTGIKNTVKNGINGVIGFVNRMINGVANGLNTVIRAVNSVSFDIPDWVPVVGGDHFGLHIPTVTAPQIPLLAKGAVLPANNPFLAMVGDQKRGTNVETPLSTIEEAVAVVMDDYLDGMMAGFQAVVDAINNKDMEVNIGDNAIGRAAARYNRRQKLVAGGAG